MHDPRELTILGLLLAMIVAVLIELGCVLWAGVVLVRVMVNGDPEAGDLVPVVVLLAVSFGFGWLVAYAKRTGIDLFGDDFDPHAD
jgi:hypothetical protein